MARSRSLGPGELAHECRKFAVIHRWALEYLSEPGRSHGNAPGSEEHCLENEGPNPFGSIGSGGTVPLRSGGKGRTPYGE